MLSTLSRKHAGLKVGTRRTRRQALAAGIAAAMAGWSAGPALADSAIGADTALGNGLNPPGRPGYPRELSGDDQDVVRRSPTGPLYGIPYAAPSEGLKTPGGWKINGSLDLGVLGGDASKKSALLRTYKDLKNGPTLDFFEVEADRADSGHYVQAFGGGLGQGDPFVGSQFGRYNDWKLKVYYNETSHVFTDTYKPVFNGTGSGQLTLAGGLKPMGGAAPVTSGSPTVGTGTCSAAAPCWRYTGADGVTKVFSGATALAGINWTGSTTTAAGTPISANSIAGSINSVLAGVDGNTELGLVRKKLGTIGEVRLSDLWKVYAGYSNEHRTGARPFGMNENNYTVELPEPIDYTTHDFLAGLSYTDSLTQFNLRGSASLFRNHISSLTVEQPWLAAATGVAAAQTTIFDLYPDNEAFNLKGEFARYLPDFYKGRLTATVAMGSNRQNDTLMTPMDSTQSAQIISAMGSSVIPGINNPGYATNTLDLKNWDGTNGSPLARSTAGQRIDTRLVDLALSLRPLTDLGLRAEWRSWSTDNKGGYTAYNPLTGQFGRGFRNSTSFDLVVGSSGTPGAIGVPCYTLPGTAAVAGCTFNGNAGVTGQSTDNPANIPIVSPPRDVRQTNATFSADYDLGPGSSVNGAIEREEIARSFRERARTWEDKFKLGYTNRSFEIATLRLSFEDGRKRGSDYEFWPVGDFGTGLPGLDWNTIVSQYLKTSATAPGWTVAPANLSGYLARYAYTSRKVDQADRDQQVFNARINTMPRDDMDLGLSMQQKDVVYPDSGVGLQRDRTSTVNLDFGYQPDAGQQLYAYYSWQSGSKTLRANAGTNATAASNTCTFTAGTVLTADEAAALCAQQIWVAAAEWNLDSHDQTNVVGLGYQTALGPVKLGLDLTHSNNRTSINYQYGANVFTTAQALAAGAGFPDMKFVQDTLSAHLLVPVAKQVTAHLLFRHENGRVSDWHYDGMPIGASAAENNATLMLDAGPQNYHANIFGVFLQFKL